MKILAVLSVVLLALAAPVFAHDAYIGSPEDPIEVEGWVTKEFSHYDETPFKGNAFVYVKNTSTEPWGDFHFKIFSIGQDVSQVYFKDASMGGVDPSSSQSGLSWAIYNNAPGGAQINLYFYNNPVMPGQFAWFQVYTDNTASQVNFGLAIWPTPVPEPSSLAALTSLFGIAGLAWRRRR